MIAVRRLQQELAIRYGVDGPDTWRSGPLDHAGRRSEVTDRQLRKADELEALALRVGPPSWDLLLGLIEPAVMTGSPAPWRATVERITGEAAEAVQAAVVRFACASLARGYAAQVADRDD